MKPSSRFTRRKGFALVVTLSLMILLTVVAVGLLSLSTISLRAAGQSESMAIARSNARLALMMALGDLQKQTGPDRAITAPASLIAEKNPSGVTGVWSPWDEGSPPESRNASTRDGKFKQWLISTVDGKPATDKGALPLVTAGAPDAVTLLGDGSLGKRSADKKDDQSINLTSTRVVNEKRISGLAWAVIDESTKARANLYDKIPDLKQSAVNRVGAPPVDGIAALSGLDGFKLTENQANRVITTNSVSLLPKVDPAQIKIYNPDLTVYSASLMTDVVAGGLKKDLSLWFSKGLSGTEKAARLYNTSKAISTLNPSDPPLALLEAYHQYYKNIDKRSGAAIPKSGGVVAKLPLRYSPIRADIASPTTPTEPVMIPSVLRVDVIFSLIARNVHGGRTKGLEAAGRPYMLHLLYLPVVTLHNPYNVPMSVEGLKVTFKNVPMAFQFLVDGQPVTTGLVPLNQLFSNSEGSTTASKDFSCTLGSAISTGTSPPFVLEAGQTKLFGTPKVAPTWTWANESPGAGADGIALFDWRNNQTSDFNLAPKLMTDAKSGAGFDIDWLAPRPLQTAAGNVCGFGEGIISLKGIEKIGVNFGPYAPPAGAGSFNVTLQLKQTVNGAVTFLDAGAFSIRYADADRLKEIVEQGTSLRFPTQRSFPETFPKSPGDKPFVVGDIFEKSDEQIKNYIKAKPFAIFSVGSRTTKESFVPTRTIADGNPVMNVAKIDLSKGKDPIGGAPLEMVMMPIRNGSAAIEDLRTTEEGFAFGGSGNLYGTPRATFYELPRGPLQSLAQFRHANLAGSGFMPMVTYTAGESRAHPQIGTDKVTGTWTDGSTMLDHTWLANEALWDHYFLSTIADQTAVQYSKAKTYKEVMGDFFALTARLPNQRFTPYNPGLLKTPADLESSASPQDLVASKLMMNGGFNVNSTSLDAWIAVLSSLREADVETNVGMDSGRSGNTAFPRVRRPTDKNIDKNVVNIRVTRWEGYRSLTDAEIAALAKEIVAEVRSRGPFLSLSHFVNRGIGSEGETNNRKGAIQAAIDRINVNTQANFDGVDLTSAQLGIHGYKSLLSGEGNSATGAPGAISQGDVLTGLGSRITVRSDTFRIRGYGEQRDASGKIILARAWCEAIVQRTPAYVDPVDAPNVKQTIPPPTGGTANQKFGRRYEIIDFRWLASKEV